MNYNSYKWHYSVITNSDEDITTVISYIEDSIQRRSVRHNSSYMLPYVLGSHEELSLNVCNIFSPEIFDADQRATNPDIMAVAEVTILN
jgi:hypothetical protein